MNLSKTRCIQSVIVPIFLLILLTGCSDSSNSANPQSTTESDVNNASGESTVNSDGALANASSTDTDSVLPTSVNTVEEPDPTTTTETAGESEPVTNVNELASETSDPELVDVTNTTTEFELIDLRQDLIRATAGYSIDQLAVVAADLAYGVGQTTIVTWPDDSWYEVIDLESNLSLCIGGSECRLLPGSYTVINHTVDERSMLGLSFTLPADLAHATLLPETSISVENEFLDGTATVNLERIQYNCEGGGTVIVEDGEGRDSRTGSATGLAERQSYLFDQCQVTLTNGLIPAGDYLIQGNLKVDLIFASGGFTQQSFFSFEEFSLTGNNGLAYQAQAQIENTRVNSAVFINRRDARITNYQKINADSQEFESITEARLLFETQNESIGRFSSLELDVDGIIRNPQTGNNQVTITTEQGMNYQLADPGFEDRYPPTPYNGSINMSAEDGSFLSVNANAFRDPEANIRRYIPQLDFDYTSAAGEQIQLVGEEQVVFPGSPNRGFCWLFRDDTTQRLECPNSEEFFIP